MSVPSDPSHCWAPPGDALLLAYHDEEWGRPVTSETGLYERLSLEAFQSGLSWRTVLAKRPAFRAAFAGFDAAAVAAFGPDDVGRLLADAGIVRNRRKIEATAANARAVVALRDAPDGPLPRLVWAHRPLPRPAPTSLADVTPTSPASGALATALRRRGIVFVGPTTAHALLQACGLVNDHLAGCVVRDEVAAEQAAARGPA